MQVAEIAQFRLILNSYNFHKIFVLSFLASLLKNEIKLHQRSIGDKDMGGDNGLQTKC
jgi:hypothetical protein